MVVEIAQSIMDAPVHRVIVNGVIPGEFRIDAEVVTKDIPMLFSVTSFITSVTIKPSATPDSMAHAVPLPSGLQMGQVHEDNTIKIIIATFVIGIVVGGAVLLTIVSLWRVHLKNQKAAEIAGASLGNPRAGCNMGETRYKAVRCAYIILSYDENGTIKQHGSGISLGNGLLVTNKHVTQGSFIFKTRVNGVERPLSLVQSSSENDVSLLKTDEAAPAAKEPTEAAVSTEQVAEGDTGATPPPTEDAVDLSFLPEEVRAQVVVKSKEAANKILKIK
jgi:hypothetical protein